jgi:hypothetical protein
MWRSKEESMAKRTALVTGASAGIGAAFARALAVRGHDLILVARRAEALHKLADELSTQHNIRAEVLPQDLTAADAAPSLARRVAELGMQVDLLVNNAGFGLYGALLDTEPDRVLQLLQLNITALTALTHAFLPAMRDRHAGAVINVSSVAGFQAVPYFAVYAASKAYVLSFSEAIAEEVRHDGVIVQALCPSTTRSEFFDVAGFPEDARSRYMSAEAVVEASLHGLDRGKTLVVPGLLNKLMVGSVRFAPRRVVTRVAGKFMK